MTGPEVESSAPPPPAPRRSLLWRRWWITGPVALLVILALTLMAAVVALPWILSPAYVKAQVVKVLDDELGLGVDIGGLDYHPLTGVELTEVRVHPPAGFERSPVEAGRVSVRYRLWPLVTGEAAVRSVVLEDARVVFELRDGRNNLDALLAAIDEALGPSAPKPSPPPDEGPPGPLMPIGVRIDSIQLGPLSFEVAGDGPRAKLSQVWLRGRGRLGTETLTASVALSIEPPAVEATPERNLTFSLPAERGPTTGQLTAEAQLPVSLVADTSAGFRLGPTAIGLDLAIAGPMIRPGEAIPPLDLGVGLSVEADPPAGAASVSRLRITNGRDALLHARASVRGLWRLLSGAVGDDIESLVTVLGLDPSEAQDRLEADVGVLNLPLTDLAPLVRALVPSIEHVGGRVQARDLRVAGSLSDVLSGRPPVLTGSLDTEQVRMTWPGIVTLDALDGVLRALRAQEGYRATGRFEIAALDVVGQRLDRGTLTVGAGVDALERATGATTATVTLAVLGLSTPPVSARAADVQVFLRGQDPLIALRASTSPVAVRADVKADALKIASVSFGRAELSAAVRADRVIDAAREPWRVTIEALVRRFVVPRAVRLGFGRLAISGTLDDLRRTGFSSALDLDGRFRGLSTAGFEADRLSLRGHAFADDVRRRPLAGSEGRYVIPQRAGVRLDATANEARYIGIRSPAAVHVNGGLDFDTGLIKVRSAIARLGPEAKLEVGGYLAGVFAGRPVGRVKADLQVPDAAGTWAKLPERLLGPVSDLGPRGGLSVATDIEGAWPSLWPDGFDWARPPVKGWLTVGTDRLGIDSRRLGLSVSALTATVAARLSPGLALVTPRLEVGRVAYRKPNMDGRTVRATVRDLRFDGTAGLEDGMWRLFTAARASEVATEIDDRRRSDSAALDINVRYAPRGDLRIERVGARLPSAGLVLRSQGRLRRAPVELLPEVKVDAEVDLAPLSAFVPALDAGTGRVGVALSVQPDRPDTVRIEGGARVDRLSWYAPGWSVGAATGSVPIRQTIYLPAASSRPAPPAGVLGDDLERRLEVLLARLLAWRAVVDPTTDILVVAPRTADHYALGPYRPSAGAELVAAELRVGRTPLTDLRAEARLEEGVLRVDRFQAGMWEGDLLFDLAVQATPELDVKARLRGTMTDLNLDLPYAQAKGIPPVEDADEKAEYLASAVLDVEFGLNDRVLEGNIDVVRLSRALVERSFGALDPSQKSAAAEALGYSELAAVRPASAKIWIAQNLLNVQFEWERVLGFDDWAPWWVVLDTLLFAPRIVSAWVLGGAWVIPTVNNSVKRASVFNFLNPYIGTQLAQATDWLAEQRSRVISVADLPDAGAGRQVQR